MDAKERHAKHRERVKKYFAAKKTAAKTTAKAPSPKPASTAGKNISYFGGKSKVMDLGHNPSQAKQAAAATQLRKSSTPNKVSAVKLARAKAATKPTPTKNPPSAATKPAVQKNATTGTSTTDRVITGLGVAAAAGATAGTVNALKGRKPTAAQSEIEASKRAVGVPSKKAVGAPKFKPPVITPPSVLETGTHAKFQNQTRAQKGEALKGAFFKAEALTARHNARRAKQGAELKTAFETAAREDARLDAKLKAIREPALGPPTKLPERPMTSLSIAAMPAAPEPRGDTARRAKVDTVGDKLLTAERRAKGLPSRATQETSMAEPIQEARAKAAITKGQKGVRFRTPQESLYIHDRRAADRREGTASRRGPDRMKKAEAGGEAYKFENRGGRNELVRDTSRTIGPKKSNRRKAGGDPRGTVDAAKGFGATEAEIAKVANSGQTTKPPTAKQAAANAVKLSGAPEDVQQMAKDIDAIKPVKLAPSGDERKAINQRARAAIRSGDPEAAKKSLAELPETGRKAGIYRSKLKAGAVGGGSGAAAPKAPASGNPVKLTGNKPAVSAAGKPVSLTGAERQAANQAARAAIRAGDPVAAKKALAGLPETGKKAVKYRSLLSKVAEGKAAPRAVAPKVDTKLAAELEAARAENKKLKGEPSATRRRKPKNAAKQRKQNFRDRQNRIDPKTGRPFPLVDKEGIRTGERLMETTIEPHSSERATQEADVRRQRLIAEAKAELEGRALREKAEKLPARQRGGEAPKPTIRTEAAVQARAAEVRSHPAVRIPEAPRHTENDLAQERHQRNLAEGRPQENVRELAEQVKERSKLGQADNMRQKMARGAADAVLREHNKKTSAAKPKAIRLTSQSSTPSKIVAPGPDKTVLGTEKVTKRDAQAEFEKLKEETTPKRRRGQPTRRQTLDREGTGRRAGDVSKLKQQKQIVEPNLKGEWSPGRKQVKVPAVPSRASLLKEQRMARGGPKPAAPKEYARMNEPNRTSSFAESVKKYIKKYSKPLTSPAIGANVGNNINKSTTGKVGRTIKGGVKAGALLTGLFALADAGVSAASENDPSKRAGVAKKAFKESAKQGGKEVAKWTAAGLAASALPGVAGTAANVGLTTLAPAYFTYKAAKEFTIPKLKKLGKTVEGAFTSRREAEQEKKASQAKYGSIEAATKTRHAKEAYKKKQKDLLTGGK